MSIKAGTTAPNEFSPLVVSDACQTTLQKSWHGAIDRFTVACDSSVLAGKPSKTFADSVYMFCTNGLRFLRMR